MQDEGQQRREQDRRDREFFASRVRPTCSDLWRLMEKQREDKGLGGNDRADETIWPLIASGIALLILEWSDMLGRVADIAR